MDTSQSRDENVEMASLSSSMRENFSTLWSQSQSFENIPGAVNTRGVIQRRELPELRRSEVGRDAPEDDFESSNEDENCFESSPFLETPDEGLSRVINEPDISKNRSNRLKAFLFFAFLITVITALWAFGKDEQDSCWKCDSTFHHVRMAYNGPPPV